MIEAWFYLVYATFLIKTHSLEKLKPILTKRKLKCKEACSFDDAEQAFVNIKKVNRFFLSRTACLEQSLALFLYATGKRKSVDWLIGVRLAPFVAHAWVETKGMPVKESETIEKYKKIMIV